MVPDEVQANRQVETAPYQLAMRVDKLCIEHPPGSLRPIDRLVTVRGCQPDVQQRTLRDRYTPQFGCFIGFAKLTLNR